ncbi:lipocalin-like domain-containing protein [Desulfonatronum parangueonense]
MFRLTFVFLMALLILPSASSHAIKMEHGFPTITGPCDFSFPRDHGEHPDHRIEWWYYTGNLSTNAGRSFGFQLTFFRSRLQPPGSEEQPTSPSSWRTSQLYLAHFAVSDLEDETFRYEKRTVRGAMNLAGVEQDADQVRIHLRDWFATITPDGHFLSASAPSVGPYMGLELHLMPLKPIAVQGEGGYSRKGFQPESASCYYSFTRLQAQGTVRVGGDAFAVTGQAWMDHEYSSNLLEEGLTGWDWFSIQLNNGWDVMAFRLRPEDQGTDHAGWSSGSLVSPEGHVTPLGPDQIEFTPLQTWTSPASGATYPLHWEIAIPSAELRLRITPRMQDQELLSEPGTGGVTYWEGAISVQGTRSDRPVSGLGYAELTGYAGPIPLGPAGQ